ncbi:Cytosolic iron-sulfur protein assembly protein [Pichia californica]|uniref:Probable cytosolic iron-sulfur protein assembly protein 1 n=1 Tax=Pichia californica TaxID=460514 RepID=A0A9P6WIL0_9ASCO|nr:Cytosolic iron-sulfur protein assembly protein [[Candida] californica]KAG0687810.1 Cytosolic iron-sulfur protein assembly protein [[Candida] californica]
MMNETDGEKLELLSSMKAHDESAWAVSVHSKLPILATCSSDKTSKIYDINDPKNPKLVTVLDEQTHTKTIRSVRFKPSKEESYPTLALGSFDSTCSIWGADSFRSEWELLAVIEGHENEVKSIDWSTDGKYLATCARDKTVWIWETDSMNEEFECIAVLSEHEGDVKFVKWNDKGDNNVFVSCSYDDTLRIWRQDDYDEDEWNCVALIRLESTVWGAAWVDNNTVVCCCDDGEVLVYECDKYSPSNENEGNTLPNTIKKVESWSISKEFKQVGKRHEGTVYSVDSRNGKIVSGGSDGCLYVYERKDDKSWVVRSSHKLSHGVREVNCVQFSNDSSVVSCGDDGYVNIWAIN